MLEQGVRIISVNEDNTFDADTGAKASIIRVTFKVDAHGPFVERFAKEKYSAFERDQKLNAFAREVR